MLAKKQRLTREQFSAFFKSGKRFHSQYATLIYTSHNTFHGSVVVSKKVSKKAVVRNKLRRRAYAQLYAHSKKRNEGIYILVLKPALMSLTRTKQHQVVSDLIAQVQ